MRWILRRLFRVCHANALHLRQLGSAARTVSLLIITTIHITGKAAASLADELSFGAVVLVARQLRVLEQCNQQADDRLERIADKFLAAGLVLLLSGAESFCF